MKRLTIVCYLIAASQLVLGSIYLFAPQWFIEWQGLTPIAADAGYPMAMFAARLLVYGVGMIIIARQPVKYAIWLDGMIAIQLIDLGAGLYYTSTGIIAFSDAAIPMLNAALFIVMMLAVRKGAKPADLAVEA